MWFVSKIPSQAVFGSADFPPAQGMTSASGGVIGMIEVIQSDFARLEAETSAAEKQSSKVVIWGWDFFWGGILSF